MRAIDVLSIFIVTASVCADVGCFDEGEDSASLLQLVQDVSQRTASPTRTLRDHLSTWPEKRNHMEDDEDVELSPALVTDLWFGQDLTSKQLPAVMKGGAKPELMQLQASSARIEKKAYVITGLFDTGTNLFQAMVDLNFEDIKNRQSLWKHSLAGTGAITSYLRNDKLLQQPINETVLVAMVRSPISNLVSLKKAPYNLKLCFEERSWSDSLRPCIGFVNHLNIPDKIDDAIMNVETPLLAKLTYDTSHGMQFSSSMDAYNRYLKQYLDLQAEGNFKKVLIVNYEDLVLNPDEVMQTFADAAGVEPPSMASMQIVEAAAKNHGNPVGREAALLKIKNRTYMETFAGNQEVMAKICQRIHLELIAERMEGSYLDPAEQRPYSDDCHSSG